MARDVFDSSSTAQTLLQLALFDRFDQRVAEAEALLREARRRLGSWHVVAKSQSCFKQFVHRYTVDSALFEPSVGALSDDAGINVASKELRHV